jgi:hypothetical protein
MSDDRNDGPSDEMGMGLHPECAAVDGDLVELALGALNGKERMVALAHLETCARCSSEVEALSAAADELLHLAPAAEPPVGFEALVFERLGLRQRPRGWRYWPVWRPRLALSVAAGVVVVAFGLGAVAGLAGGTGNQRHLVPTGPGSPTSATGLYAADLDAGGHPVGRVLVYAGNPTWLFMYMDDAHWQGALHCEVVVDQGKTIALGRFWLSEGKGAWAASVNQPAGRLSQARIVSATGAVLATADLS